MNLELNAGSLSFVAVATKKKPAALLRVAGVFGCTVATPKSARKGHPHTFRLDVTEKDTKGDKKYIVSLASAELLECWMEHLLTYSTADQAAVYNDESEEEDDGDDAALRRRLSGVLEDSEGEMESPRNTPRSPAQQKTDLRKSGKRK